MSKSGPLEVRRQLARVPPCRAPGDPVTLGLMGYMDGRGRVIGAHPGRRALLYNLGCNHAGEVARVDTCRHQYVFWTKATGPEPGEPLTCADCGATRAPGGTIRLEELHPIVRDVVLALTAAKSAAHVV
jgi:hypothetical protein